MHCSKHFTSAFAPTRWQYGKWRKVVDRIWGQIWQKCAMKSGSSKWLNTGYRAHIYTGKWPRTIHSPPFYWGDKQLDRHGDCRASKRAADGRTKRAVLSLWNVINWAAAVRAARCSEDTNKLQWAAVRCVVAHAARMLFPVLSTNTASHSECFQTDMKWQTLFERIMSRE